MIWFAISTRLACAASFLLIIGCSREPATKSQPSVPVLCLGDSITHGWSEYGNWPTPQENCRSTRYFLAHLDQWGSGRVVIFNAGLWDIKENVPLDEYRENLRAIIHKVRGERIYFCTTTPDRTVDDSGKKTQRVMAYNRAAHEVMASEHIAVIDLYGPCMAHRDWWLDDKVHYTPQGYQAMAKIVAEAIR